MINTILLSIAMAFSTPTTTTCDAACMVDLTGNGYVGAADLRIFMSHYDGIIDKNTPLIDFNCDGLETISDYLIFISYYESAVPDDCE